MPDLSTVQGRQTTQNRITNNRDSVLPNRRIVEAPDAIVRADMRNAFRGDSVDEVRRALGLVDKVVDSAVDLRKVETQIQNRKDSADGGLDAVQGKALDPAKAKSVAYQRAYYNVSAEQKQSAFETDIETKVTSMVNQGAHLDEIHKFITDSVAEHANQAKDIYPTNEARMKVAEGTMKFAGQLEAKLNASIKARADKEMVDARAATVAADIQAGKPVDFEAGIRPLIEAGIAPAVAKETVRHAITAVALDPDHPRPELLSDLLDAKQADGKTPSLSAEEQLQVENSFVQAEGLLKKKQKEDKDRQQDALTLKWYEAANKGQVVEGEIDAAVAKGLFTGQEAIGLRSAFSRLRDDHLDGEANEDAVIKLELELAKRHPNYEAVRARATAMFHDGRLGTGRAAAKAYLGLMRSTAHDSQTADETERGGASKDDYADGKWLLGKLLPVESDDGVVDPDSARMFIQAKAEWRNRVKNGESPSAAADAVAKTWGPRVAGVAKSPAPTTKKTTFKYDNQGNLK
ncbi:hypothetical protein [Caulobacter segnis]|uniref:Uncharacterized protein n=1 Tax=Caulobacter segnis TaxID=88688 RepID=A0A2W5VKC5_9CAUL|nr:hypothetical protein [Caulobacter segnis]PZR35775.1 MAG: hypothetical protein DI526_05665 [Caulobacter segnis]